MLARMRTVSAAAHGTEANMRRRRLEDAAAADCIVVYSYGLPGPGVAGGLLRLGYGVERVGGALRRLKDAREGLGEDESIPMGDKVIVAVDVVVGVTNIVVGACDFAIGACDFTQYARGALARFRAKSSSGGSRGKRSYLGLRKRICERGKHDLQFEDLPEDVQCIIFSKLELKEAVRSSVLSSKWKNTWMIHSKLRFDARKMFGKYMPGRYPTLKFVDNVNRVLKLQHGKVVETLEIKVEFDKILAVHLDNWVSFAAASRTKNLALDLVPSSYRNYIARYIFPFELLDGETMSRLQQIQLRFVSLNLPSQFSGFPKLRRLDLYSLHVTRNDLQDILSGCSKLEWLSIVRCDLEDELIVDHPFSHLVYLRIAHCKMTKIELLHAVKLRTFIYNYNGAQLPVHTIQKAQELKDADIAVSNFITFEHALSVLPKMLTRVQNLTLQAPLQLKSSALLENSSKFPELKHLKLLLRHSPEDLDNILSLASFLRAAPLIEELEIDFNISGSGYGNEVVAGLRNLPKCPNKHLRNICITGFKGIKGQAEFLVHAVENAPALEILTINTTNRNGACLSQAAESICAYIARRCLEGKISPKTKLHINNSSCEGRHQEWVLV